MHQRQLSSSARKRVPRLEELDTEEGQMLSSHPTQPIFSSNLPLTPRTPKSVRTGVMDAERNEVEMRLLGEVDGQVTTTLPENDEDGTLKIAKRSLSKKDKQGMALLSVLCTSTYLFMTFGFVIYPCRFVRPHSGRPSKLHFVINLLSDFTKPVTDWACSWYAHHTRLL